MKTHTYHEFDLLSGKQRFHQKTYLNLWGHVDIQMALQMGRERFGNALCLCRKEPLKLQIRLRDGRYHLAVWPGEAEKHDSECIFFRDELTQQKPVALPGTAEREAQKNTVEHEQTPRRWDLRMAYQTDAPQQIATDTRAHRLDQVKATEGQTQSCPIVSVKKLMMLLWEKADLCRWHPTWTRDWGRVRWQLEKLAHELSINGLPLDQLLYVPRPYRESIKDSLNDEWESFVRTLPVVGQRRTSPRLLISAVRRYVPASPGRSAVVHLRHLRYPIGLAEACDAYLQRDCRGSIKQINAKADMDASIKNGSTTEGAHHLPEVVGCFLVDGTSRGGVFARAAWLMNVHPVSFIPANNPNAVMLVDSLIDQGYAFSRLLSDEPPMNRKLPEWIVRHALDPKGEFVSRIALEILDRGCSREFVAARQQMAEAMAFKGMPTWTWTPTGSWSTRSVPALPPNEMMDIALANEQLQTILNSAEVDYRYGISAKSAS